MRVAWFFVASAFASGLIVATFVDFEFQIIPDQVSVSGAWLAPALSLALPWLHRPVFELPHLPPANLLPWNLPHLEGLAASLLGAAAGAGATWGVGLLGRIVFRKEAMGFGDVKLMAMVGGLMGWKEALAVFFLACVVGSAVGVAMMIVVKTANAVRAKPLPFDHYLAFGPYLAIGALAVFFFSGELMEGLLAYQRWLQGLVLPVPPAG
jgi:leader peptidase (prepilin peptidase)/N-methyltransferase